MSWRGHSVEEPRDGFACRMVANERHAQQYIDQFGDVEIVHIGREEYNTLESSSVFKAEQRKEYCDLKAGTTVNVGVLNRTAS